MTEPRKQSMAILAQVAEFLANLPEDQLDDLQSGAARLTLIPAGSDQPLQLPNRTSRARATKDSIPSASVTAIAQTLADLDTREAAADTLKPLKLAQLKEVAMTLGITIVGSMSKEKLTVAIVERTVGNRLDSLAIRGTSTLPY